MIEKINSKIKDEVDKVYNETHLGKKIKSPPKTPPKAPEQGKKEEPKKA